MLSMATLSYLLPMAYFLFTGGDEGARVYGRNDAKSVLVQPQRRMMQRMHSG